MVQSIHALDVDGASSDLAVYLDGCDDELTLPNSQVNKILKCAFPVAQNPQREDTASALDKKEIWNYEARMFHQLHLNKLYREFPQESLKWNYRNHSDIT